jgi:hypothetical protein
MTSSADDGADRHCLAARFVDGPHVSAPDQAEQRLIDWLTDLEPAQSAALDDLLARFPRPTCSIWCAPTAPARCACCAAIRSGILPG